MIIDITNLTTGDCFQFIGMQTVYKVINAHEYKSLMSGNVFGMPTFGHLLDVLCEDWMSTIEKEN